MKVSLKFTFDYSIWSFWNKCKKSANQQISKKAKKRGQISLSSLCKNPYFIRLVV